ncbi:MAG: AbrB/MazE/SpoVT family DNA-binding domain-containing protein [Snowella sp.]|nr:AbrB/MazE/SpoVT family DNA-binding domain-containing protein [Snowella sp.]
MRTKIIKIGNSQGIRLPKTLLEQTGIQADVEIEVNGDRLILRNASQVREGWEQAFAEMANAGDDILLDENLSTNWEQDEWQW